MRVHPLWPALGWASLILVLCLMPGQALPQWEWADLLSVDKAVHAFLFAVLYVLVHRWLIDRGMAPSKALWVGLIACTAYGASTELMQQLPALGRRGDLGDLLANTAGVLLGMLVAHRPAHRTRNGDPRTASEQYL